MNRTLEIVLDFAGQHPFIFSFALLMAAISFENLVKGLVHIVGFAFNRNIVPVKSKKESGP